MEFINLHDKRIDKLLKGTAGNIKTNNAGLNMVLKIDLLGRTKPQQNMVILFFIRLMRGAQYGVRKDCIYEHRVIQVIQFIN